MAHGATKSDSWLADLGKIVSTDSTGITTVFKTNSAISLQKDSVRNVFNHQIVIHSISDDSREHTEYSGSRIACGNIRQGKSL